jgi:HAMP domain-containing protein
MFVLQSDVLTVMGGVCNVLLWQALDHARRIRKENQAMRLSESPLNKAETVEAAANTIREMFVEIFVHRKG